MALKPEQLEFQTLKALGAAIVADPGLAAQQLADTGLTSTDFENPECSKVFGALSVLVRDRRPLDVVALTHTLGASVRREVVISVSTSSDYGALPERARVLRDAVSRRNLVKGLQTALRLAQDEGATLEQAAAEGLKALDSARSAQPAVRKASADLIGLVDRLEQVQMGTQEPVLTTGIHALDACIGGLQPTLTVIGALPGVGKSALLASVLRNLARRSIKAGVFSLEDAGEWISRRLMSESACVPLFVLGNRKLNAGQMQRIMETSGDIGTDLEHVLVDDRTGMTAAEIVASAREMVVKHGARAIFVDHLGEVRLPGGYGERHDLQISGALQELRALAKMHGVPVVVFCHMKRRDGLSIADEPKLTDFAFSAGVERMARVALGLSRPQGDAVLKASVLKQTNGQANVAVELEFRGPAGLVGNGTPSKGADEHYAEQEAAMRIWTETGHD